MAVAGSHVAAVAAADYVAAAGHVDENYVADYVAVDVDFVMAVVVVVQPSLPGVEWIVTLETALLQFEM